MLIRGWMISLLLCMSAVAQERAPTNDLESINIVVFENAGQPSEVGQWVRSPVNPELYQIVQSARVRVIDSSKAIYKDRYEQAVEPDRLPAIVVADKTGGVIYLADKSTLPKTQYQLAREIQHFAEVVDDARPAVADSSFWPLPVSQEEGLIEWQDCPDGTCPTPDADTEEQRKPLFPRLRPSRETSKQLFDGWFSTNQVGVNPLTIVAGIALVLLALMLRSQARDS